MKKIALITGASRGIGAAVAKELAKKGYHLSLCCSRSVEQLQALAEQWKEEYRIQVLVFGGDVGNFDFVEEMVRETLQQFGQIDLLVNNAGISHIGLLTDMSVEEWNRILSVNLSSVFFACKCVIPSMVARQMGRIINISSVWGTVGASCEVAYSASKGGVNTLTKALAKELAPSGIQVNAIACGVIDTQMNACFDEEERQALAEEIPAGRFGTSEEVGQMVHLLAEGPEYLTGQILTFDGGWC